MSPSRPAVFVTLAGSVLLLSGCFGGSMRAPLRRIDPLGADSAWKDGVRFVVAKDTAQRVEVGYLGIRSGALEFKVRWTNLGKCAIEIDPSRFQGQAFYRRTLDPGSKGVPPRAGFPGGKKSRPAIVDSGWEPMDPVAPESRLERMQALRVEMENVKNPYDTPGADVLNAFAALLGTFDHSPAGRERTRQDRELQENKDRDRRDWERDRKLAIDRIDREMEWWRNSALRRTELEVGATLERSILVPAKIESDSLRLMLGSGAGRFAFAFRQSVQKP